MVASVMGFFGLGNFIAPKRVELDNSIQFNPPASSVEDFIDTNWTKSLSLSYINLQKSNFEKLKFIFFLLTFFILPFVHGPSSDPFS